MVEKRFKDVKSLVKNYARALQKHIRVQKVILFGSYARNAPRDYSDIDLAIVSPDFHGGTEREHLLLARIAKQFTPLIEAWPYCPKDLKDCDPASFEAEILRTGKLVYKG